MVVQQRTWMRVTVDGEVAFEGRVLPGSAYPFAGEERVELVTGNGAGLQVFFNQQDLGLLGLFGEVVQRVFTVQGVLPAHPGGYHQTWPRHRRPTRHTNQRLMTEPSAPHAYRSLHILGTMKDNTFHLVSLGCAKNTVDSASHGAAAGRGWLPVGG